MYNVIWTKKGKSYCCQRGQFFLTKRGKVVWLFYIAKIWLDLLQCLVFLHSIMYFFCCDKNYLQKLSTI